MDQEECGIVGSPERNENSVHHGRLRLAGTDIKHDLQ